MNITPALIKLASAFITEVMQNLSSDEYPSGKDRSGRDYMQIEDTIERGNPVSKGRGGEIEVFMGSEKAPYAKLYEFGKGAYDIPESPAGIMKFAKEYWPQYKPPPPAPDFFFFPQVRHPVSKPKPYIKPEYDDPSAFINKAITRDDMKKLIFGDKPQKEVWK